MTDEGAPLGRVWAGWRGEYIVSADVSEKRDAARGVAAEAEERCVFCRILASGADDEASNIVWRGAQVLAILNRYPYSSGHLMVMPYRHVGELETLDVDETPELWATVTDATRAVKAAYNADGLNIGINLGSAAGAGIPGHLHVHLVPRWNGDTNFMATTANTRVLPETLERSRSKLIAAWPR